VEARAEAGDRVELVVTRADGTTRRETVFDFGASPGVAQGTHNTDASIASFARSCFNHALATGQDLWFATKDTISKTYDHRFKDIFAELHAAEYAHRFAESGIDYSYTLIDDAVARVLRSSGGFIWACKNYDGDVMSDMVATAFGSLGMMTSVLASPDGAHEYEAAHGTVTRHHRRHLDGEPTSTNPVATIFAWTGALARRAALDGSADLAAFAARLEAAVRDTIESGTMTGDLHTTSTLPTQHQATTTEFIDAVASQLIR
jgi:isocitrate dehydrogenase